VLTIPDLVVIGLRAAGFVAVLGPAGAAIFLGVFRLELANSRRLIRKLTFATAAGACLLVFFQHVLQPARMTASFSGIWDGDLQAMFLATDAGTAHALRLAGLVLIAWSATSAHAMRDQLGLIGAVVALGSFVLMGHTAADDQRWVLSVLLVSHLLVAAFWFGALMAFWLVSTRESVLTIGALVQQFSADAGRLVPLVLIAGLAMGVLLLPDFRALNSAYGVLLLVKLVGFAGLMVLAVWNKYRLGPAISRGDAGAVTTFRRVVGIEWLMIAGVLVLTSVMTGLYGPK
jgi:putative copper export protein